VDLPPGTCGESFYDPMLEQASIKRLQAAPIGPDPPDILQCERTASSGRKLIVTISGGSYFCLSVRLDSSIPHLSAYIGFGSLRAPSHGSFPPLFTSSVFVTKSEQALFPENDIREYSSES
jgi:hypothetical protein